MVGFDKLNQRWLRPTDRRLSAGGWAGVLGVAVPLVGLIVLPIWTFPSTNASGADVLAFARGHTGALQTMMLAYTVGVTLWLVFGAAVWARMRAALPGDSMLTTCFAGGLISFVTLLLAGFTCFDILVYRLPPPAEARLLYDLTFGLLAMSGMPTAAALTAYAIAVYRHRVFARPTGHLAAVTVAAHVSLLLSFIVSTAASEASDQSRPTRRNPRRLSLSKPSTHSEASMVAPRPTIITPPVAPRVSSRRGLRENQSRARDAASAQMLSEQIAITPKTMPSTVICRPT